MGEGFLSTLFGFGPEAHEERITWGKEGAERRAERKEDRKIQRMNEKAFGGKNTRGWWEKDAPTLMEQEDKAMKRVADHFQMDYGKPISESTVDEYNEFFSKYPFYNTVVGRTPDDDGVLSAPHETVVITDADPGDQGKNWILIDDEKKLELLPENQRKAAWTYSQLSETKSVFWNPDNQQLVVVKAGGNDS